MEKELITIVMPVYNRASVLPATLDSIGAQSCKDFRMIVVDNGSGDGSIEVVQQWAAKQSFQVSLMSESKRGASAARQCGLNAVKTEWTLFFDSDDIMLPNHIERVYKAIQSNPDAEMIWWPIEMHIGPIRKFCVPPKKNLQYRSIMDGHTATQRYCARTDLFKRVGGWNSTLRIWDDIELGARVLLQNPRIAYIEGEASVVYRLSEDSISNNETASQIVEMEKSLDAIRNTLGDKARMWCDLKLLVTCAPSDIDGAVRRRIVSNARHSARLLLLFAYYYRRMGLRGIYRLLEPIIAR